MKHFINPDFLAPNVLTIPVDPVIPREFASIGKTDSGSQDYCRVQPPWDSDILWISAATPAAFACFESAFDRLGVAGHVAPYLDLERNVRLYAGFLVTRSVCDAPAFHCDWIKTNNEAFTFMTPVSDNSEGFGLLYRKLDGEIGEYDYKSGEGIVFGDHFVHSTKPGRSDDPVVLLCFTFGTDKMVHWEKILTTAGSQGRLVRRPDGKFQTLESHQPYPAS